MHRFSTRFRADFHFLEPVNDQPYWRMSFERQKVKVNETSRGLSFDCAYLFQDASRSITRETRQASAILLKFVNDEIRPLFQIELWRKIGWMVCMQCICSRIGPKTRIYIYQNKYTRIRYLFINEARLKGQSFTCPGNTYTRRTIDFRTRSFDGEGGLKGIISGQNSSRFDEFRRNGRREVGNFAAQERNYGSPDETWLAIGLSSYPGLRRAPPILTEARPLFSPGRRRHAAASNGLAGGFN